MEVKVSHKLREGLRKIAGFEYRWRRRVMFPDPNLQLRVLNTSEKRGMEVLDMNGFRSKCTGSN